VAQEEKFLVHNRKRKFSDYFQKENRFDRSELKLSTASSKVEGKGKQGPNRPGQEKRPSSDLFCFPAEHPTVKFGGQNTKIRRLMEIDEPFVADEE
jgi:hypothetical protein